jgi:hypothetical protein
MITANSAHRVRFRTGGKGLALDAHRCTFP